MQVIVSLTSIPPRLPYLQPVLYALLHTQTHPVAKIIVNIPNVYRNWPGEVTIPAFCKQPRIIVNRLCVDEGPGTKLLGTVTTFKHSLENNMLLYVDDDQVYPPDLVAQHLLAHRLCPKTVFAGRGSVMTADDRALVQSPWFRPVHTVDGVHGVSVLFSDVSWPLFVQRSRHWFAQNPLAVFADDVVFSMLFSEQNLALRLAPRTGHVIPLKHAGDEHALCLGRQGAILTTTERYQRVVGQHVFPTLFLHDMGLVSVADAVAGPPGLVGLAVFAYQRPELLARVLQSLLRNPWYTAHQPPVFLFLDGVVHPVQATLEGDIALWQQNQAVFRQYIPTGHIIGAPINYGVGLMQYWALSTLAARFEYIIMLEDDLVLGPTYLQTLWNLRELCFGSVSSVQAGYRKEDGDPHVVRVTRAATHHVHYWGWLTTAAVWRRIATDYTAAVQELFVGQYYRRRDFQRIQAWFQGKRLPDYGHYSQDWVRDGCFCLTGMPYKIYTPCRRGVPVGRHGLHSSSLLFDQMKLDDSSHDVQPVPPVDLQQATLTWDPEIEIGVVPPACRSVLGGPARVRTTSLTVKHYITETRQPLPYYIQTVFN